MRGFHIFLLLFASAVAGCEKRDAHAATVIVVVESRASNLIAEYERRHTTGTASFLVAERNGSQEITINTRGASLAEAESSAAKIKFELTSLRVEMLEAESIFPSSEELKEHQGKVDDFEAEVDALQRKAESFGGPLKPAKD